MSCFCAFGNKDASEIPAGEASDRKKSPQAATKTHDAFALRGALYSSGQGELSRHVVKCFSSPQVHGNGMSFSSLKF